MAKARPEPSKSGTSKKSTAGAARKPRTSRGISAAAPRRRPRRREIKLAFEALSIEGGLLSPEWLALAAQLQATQQAPADYRTPKGLNLRDEIGRYWRIAQAHHGDLAIGRTAGADPAALAERFVLSLLRDCFGFQSLAPSTPIELAGRAYPIGHSALGGRAPLVIAPAGSGLDTPSPVFGDDSRRRSAFGLCQEYLNAADSALWGLCTDGATLRLLRDNASLTRPAWIEADLSRMFTEERYADFAALWLLAHESRFGRVDQPVSECALEAWRASGLEKGTRAREFLRSGVEEAVVALGQGFLTQADNTILRRALESGQLTKNAYFQELLRLVYRLIFLLTVEERELLHPPRSDEAGRALYAAGYGMRRLRERSVKRSAHDRHSDLWEATKIVLRGVATGEPQLALPALAGIFARSQCPYVDASRLENRALLLAVFKLSWLREDGGLARVNWRDMGPEELGSVYESLLELVPVVGNDRRSFGFATGGEAKGNARKTTGSYYTPDSLVQLLLDSALEPVIADTVAQNPTRPVDALLGLSIVDPACGSGHFLLAAARRLAGHVARLQTNGTPSAQEYRHALRHVIGKCIYGVDLNLMAVELCKVSLWMEAVEPGRPLTFLDAHIRCGNSLFGTTPELMSSGIPDAAFEPITGDDRKAASALKKRNKAARAGQQGLELGFSRIGEGGTIGLLHAVQAVDAASDAELESLEHKQRAWQVLLESQVYLGKQLIADAWCAAFVWKMESGPASDHAPTHNAWQNIQFAPDTAPTSFVAEVRRLAEEYKFFHWHLAFPQVFALGGFDVVLGNPPWERVKAQEQEFFAARSVEIMGTDNAADRKALIAKLPERNPQLWTEWTSTTRRSEGESHFILHSGRYPLCGKGDVNTYAVFSELDLAILRSTGRSGFIVPTGIATDDSTKAFFESLMQTSRLSSLYSFWETRRFFLGTDNRNPFALVTVRPSLDGASALCGFDLRSIREITEPGRTFDLNYSDVVLLNPNTKTCPVFRSRRAAELSLAIYRRLPILVRVDRSKKTSDSPWRIKLGTLFHMTNDAALFQTRAALEQGGWSRIENTFERRSEHMMPLYEGRLGHQFNHRFAQEPDGNLISVSPAQLNDPIFRIEPHYWVAADVANEALDRHPALCRTGQLGFRRVTRAGDERTVIACILPWLPSSYGFVISSGPSAADLLVLGGLYNSFAFDFLARGSLSQPSFPQSAFEQLPAPTPAQVETGNSMLGCSMRAFVASRVLELTYTAWDLEAFARDVGYRGPPFRWDPARRLLIRAELDAAVFHLYGLSRDDVDYVMETFQTFKKYDERDHGEYRTKRVILESYDAMVEATRTGKPYRTRLDPPPADSRVSHPPRELSARGDTGQATVFIR